MTTPPDNAPRKGNALFALGAVLLSALAVLLIPPEEGVGGRDSAYLVGWFVGGAVMMSLVIAIVYGIARVVRRNKAPPRLSATAFWTALTMALLMFMGIMGRAGRHVTAAPVTREEREGLQIDPDSIRHAGLHFALPNPGPSYQAAPVIQARLDSMLAAEPNMVGWAVTSEEQGSNLIIQLIKQPTIDEARFRAFVRGMRGGVEKHPGASVTEDSVTWTPPEGEFRLTLLNPAGVEIRTRCISRSRTDGHFILCLQTSGADSSGLDAARAGLSMRR